jgi:hypothetical protein
VDDADLWTRAFAHRGEMPTLHLSFLLFRIRPACDIIGIRGCDWPAKEPEEAWQFLRRYDPEPAAASPVKRAHMEKDFTVCFASTDKQAARDGTLFALTAVDSAYATGPINYVTTNLLEQLGYLGPNAFGGLTISPQVSDLFAAALEIFKQGEQTEPGEYPYVGKVESPTGIHTVWISPNSTPGKHTLYLPEDC